MRVCLDARETPLIGHWGSEVARMTNGLTWAWDAQLRWRMHLKRESSHLHVIKHKTETGNKSKLMWKLWFHLRTANVCVYNESQDA